MAAAVAAFAAQARVLVSRSFRDAIAEVEPGAEAALERTHRSTLPVPAITVGTWNLPLSNASALPSGNGRQSKVGCAAQIALVEPVKLVFGLASGS